MKDKKLQVFVSSTYTDLKAERQAAVEAILSSGHIPAGMELFTAGNESQMTVIERWIDESDVYLLILGGRYGSIDKISGKSYTHLEFEYAVLKNKPLFAVVITEEALKAKIQNLGLDAIEQEHPKELKNFREIVLNNLVKFWDDSKDIKLAIHETLSEFIYTKDLTGWIRGDNSVNMAFLAEEIARLTKENYELRNKLSDLSTSSNALYSGLTYSQLETLTKNEIITTSKGKTNLFQYIFEKGPELCTSCLDDEDDETIFNKLKEYKVVEMMRYGDYKFTEDGHNFYLKALSLSKAPN